MISASQSPLGTTPHTLPDFLLIPDPCGQWHLRDRHGAFLFEGLGLCLETLLILAEGTGAHYKIIIPIPPYITEKGKQNVIPISSRTHHDPS